MSADSSATAASLEVAEGPQKTSEVARRDGEARLRQGLDLLEGQNPHPLASVNRTLVRFGLDHELVALDRVKAA
jgi:hypothetical protein